MAYFGTPAGGTSYAVSLQDINNNVLGITSVVTGTTYTPLSPFDITWSAPIVFDRMSLNISVPAAAGVRLDSFHLPVTESGFTVRGPGN
jgi:hypothetical protein